MRIVTILGSPKKDGTTAKVLQWIEERLTAKGVVIDRIDISDHQIKGCGECMSCKTGKTEFCMLEDHCNVLLEKLVRADLALFAAPVFCWGFPAQLKAFLDRMYCLVDDYRSDPDYRSDLKDKPLALLLTAGGPRENNAELVIKAFDNLVLFIKAQNAGNLLIPYCKGPDSVGESVQKQAEEFAETLLTIPR